MTAGQYEQTWAELRKAGQTHPHGLHHHVAGQQGICSCVSEIRRNLNADLAETWRSYGPDTSRADLSAPPIRRCDDRRSSLNGLTLLYVKRQHPRGGEFFGCCVL